MQTIVVFLIIICVCACSNRNEHTKNDADQNGLELALKDVDLKMATFGNLSTDALIQNIVLNHKTTYGGYDYYYSSQLNYQIRKELLRRWKLDQTVLIPYYGNEAYIFEGINGPGDTIGGLCKHIAKGVNSPRFKVQVHH